MEEVGGRLVTMIKEYSGMSKRNVWTFVYTYKGNPTKGKYVFSIGWSMQ